MTVDNASLPPGMGQCSVTGKIVPEDDLVTIHNQRVCAEGKAILLERLRSGEAMPGESIKPTVMKRFGAIFLDIIIVALIGFVIGFGIGAAFGVPSPLMIGIITIVSTAATVVYFGAQHASSGQTVGKRAAGLKVVSDLDNGPITAQTAYVRALLYAGPSFITGIAQMSGVAVAATAVGLLVAVYGLANTICALVDNRQRALHDRISGTRVIEVQ